MSKKTEVYCNICKVVKYGDEVHPLQSRICKSCNDDLQYRKDGIRYIQVAEWGESHVIVSYKPMPEAKD